VIAVIFKYLHVITMFAAVTLMFGGEVLFHLLRRRGDLHSLRRFLEVVLPVFRIGVGLLTLGVGFGLLAATTIGFSLTAGWLLLAYALIAAIYVVGFGVGVPYFNRVRAALEDASLDAAPNDQPAGEAGRALRRILDDPRWVFDLVVSVVLYAAIIFVMVAKPLA
jgi:hypothetical protein